MRILYSSYFLIALAIYLGIQIGHLLDIDMPIFIKNHLADLVCMPIVLCLSLWLVQRLPLHKVAGKRRLKTKLSFFTILTIVVFWAVYFEMYLPNQSTRYTSDPLDALCFLIGAASFFSWQQRQWSVQEA